MKRYLEHNFKQRLNEPNGLHIYIKGGEKTIFPTLISTVDYNSNL